MTTRGAAGSPAKRAAKRPPERFVTVTLEGEFEGWEMTARADFPSRILIDLQSGNIERMLEALDRIVTEHNFPNADDEVAEHLADVEPYGGVVKAVEGLTDALGKLPNR